MVEDSPASIFNVTPGGVSKDFMNKDLCKAACFNVGSTVDTAGITSGNVCLCGLESTGKINLTFLSQGVKCMVIIFDQWILVCLYGGKKIYEKTRGSRFGINL